MGCGTEVNVVIWCCFPFTQMKFMLLRTLQSYVPVARPKSCSIAGPTMELFTTGVCSTSVFAHKQVPLRWISRTPQNWLRGPRWFALPRWRNRSLRSSQANGEIRSDAKNRWSVKVWSVTSLHIVSSLPYIVDIKSVNRNVLNFFPYFSNRNFHIWSDHSRRQGLRRLRETKPSSRLHSRRAQCSLSHH